ncbi:hypothetical protein [Ereboglobus luteus]|uniref:Uncharacterized protein n=1 Tax=Ereboglobus luteus TaxID=1796921 RepID=A0A2U8E646_9BACT|nr:hypothetical protein [Ereboglobus luteus]AWI10343.1 hypothetical protein CKA38_14725 [Ereboglobus luteus]
MKRLAPFALFAALFCLFVGPLLGAVLPAATTTAPPADKSPAGTISSTITTITGIAISPLLGTGVYGAYKYVRASDEDRAKLAWYAQPAFFIPALLIALACAFKDTLGAVLPAGWKKPLDILETVENKASGLVAAGAVVPFTMDSLRGLVAEYAAPAPGATESTGLAMMNLAAIDFSWLLNILTVPLGIAVFAVVWMASHAINVLILLSPWGAIDAALKSARTALLGLITVTATLDPKIAAIMSVAVIIISYFVAGWSFRLMIFGTAFTWDYFTFRKYRFKVNASANKVFSGAHLEKVPLRTFGRLINEPETGGLRFAFKPWLVMPERSVEVKLKEPFVGRGLFFSSVRDGEYTLFLLPPRYRGHEEEVVKTYNLSGGVKDAGLLKAWSSMRELFGGSATKTQVT